MNEIYIEKFGGASVNSAETVRNVASIILTQNNKRIIVFSAMGKTTNALESIVKDFYKTKKIKSSLIKQIEDNHLVIIKELFGDGSKEIESKLKIVIKEIEETLIKYKNSTINLLYDAIVSYGEIISTLIISTYFKCIGIEHILIDARQVIKTDSNFRGANVDWRLTKKTIKELVSPLFKENQIIITQGYISSDAKNNPTTLGREGSDYSAAIFAYFLKAKNVTIWKDVPGLLNADPKIFSKTVKFDKIPFSEAIELSYYGASIIHPKTLKPLENKSIPLFVKSFIDPKASGSVICHCKSTTPNAPSYIFKDNQTLLTLFPKDFSFIVEERISAIFSIFAQYGIRINLMQNSALSFSVCFDLIDQELLYDLIDKLSPNYTVKYNDGLRMITIRHYNEKAISSVIKDEEIIIEQRSRVTAQFLVKK